MWLHGLINGLVNIRGFNISQKQFILVAADHLPKEGLQDFQMHLLHTSHSGLNSGGRGV